jgi:uncharacterized protein (TIGR02246 family)
MAPKLWRDWPMANRAVSSYIGTKLTVSGSETSRSSRIWTSHEEDPRIRESQLTAVALVCPGICSRDFRRKAWQTTIQSNERTQQDATRAAGFVTSVVFGMAAAGLAAMALAQAAADERAVAKVIADRQVAWNTGDAEGYARLLTADADLSSSSGQIARGRDAVIRLYLNQRDGVFAGAMSSMKVIQTRMIRPDVAIVDVDRELTGLKAYQPPRPRERPSCW